MQMLPSEGGLSLKYLKNNFTALEKSDYCE
jgi:hypothetical protein